TATTAYGIAVISGLPGGEKLKILASKPECNAATLDAAGIGLVPTEAGAVSFRGANLTPLTGPACGPGPYATVTGVVYDRSIMNYDTLTPLPGATLTFDACPGVSVTSGADGSYAIGWTISQPTMTLIAKAGYIDAYVGERLAQNATPGFGYGMRSDAWR